MTRGERRLLALAVVAATTSLAAGVGGTDLWPPNETRVAEISREMVATGVWSVPHLNGVPFVEEPPLFYWLQAGLYRLAGAPSATAARLPAVAGAALGVLAAAALARAVGVSAGIAALVLATAPEYWWMARTGTPDTANAAMIGVALVALHGAWRSGSTPLLAVAVGAGVLAFWLKSFLGVGLATGTALAFLALAGPGRLRPRAIVGAGILLAAGTMCWLLVLWHEANGAAVSFFLVANHLGRLVGGGGQGHARPFYYYVPNVLFDLLPWSIVLPAAVLSAARERAEIAHRFPLVWAVVMTLLLTASVGKSAHYLLPAYPAFAVLIARWWTRAPAGRFDRITWTALVIVVLVVMPAAGLALGSLEPTRVVPILMTRGHRLGTALGIALDTRLASLGWWSAGVLLVCGVGLRPRRPVLTAVAVATSALLVHLLAAVVTLPAFNPFASARPVGEALGRAADDGVDVFTYGFDNPEAVSPFMFYGRRALPAAASAKHLVARLDGGRACALVPVKAWTRLPPRLRALPATRRNVGEIGLVLLPGRMGECPEVSLAGDPDSDYRPTLDSMTPPSPAP